MSWNKAQASLEFLVLLAIAIVIVTSIILISQSQMGNIRLIKEENDARNSLQDISAAAKDVYAQGEGARRQVYITLPSGYEPNETYVKNRTIKLRARGTDYAASEDFDLHGSLPGTSGPHWVWVISEGNKVRIGSAMITLGKNSVYLLMTANSTAGATIPVESIWDRNISVDTSAAWNPTEVGMGVSPASFPLDLEESQDVSLSFTSSESAGGFYSGELSFIATDGENNETVVVPITVEVMTYGTLEPPLIVVPDFWGEAVYPGMVASKQFFVCTNDFTAPTGVTFTPSSGAPGSWVGNTSALGPLGAGICAMKILSLTVPNGTAAGTYEGNINVVGQGVPNAQDNITLFMTVMGAGTCLLNESSMCNCPVGSDYLGVPMCMCMPATIYVQDGKIVGGPDSGKPYNGTILGGPGEDIIAGTNGSDIIYGDESIDIICGGDGDDTIYGHVAGDVIDGGMGNDIIDGESGDDKIYGKGGNDIIFGGQGDDQLDGGEGNDQLNGSIQNDLIFGGPGDDTISGGDNDDTICGNAGSDFIFGEPGKDTLDGGSGADAIDAGKDNDACYRGESVANCENLPGGYPDICGPS